MLEQEEKVLRFIDFLVSNEFTETRTNLLGETTDIDMDFDNCELLINGKSFYTIPDDYLEKEDWKNAALDIEQKYFLEGING